MYLTVYEQLTWLTLGDSTQGRTRIMLIFNELRPRGFRLPRQAVQASSPNGADSPGNWRRPDFIMGACLWAGTCTTHVKSLRQKNAALQENGR